MIIYQIILYYNLLNCILSVMCDYMEAEPFFFFFTKDPFDSLINNCSTTVGQVGQWDCLRTRQCNLEWWTQVTLRSQASFPATSSLAPLPLITLYPNITFLTFLLDERSPCRPVIGRCPCQSRRSGFSRAMPSVCWFLCKAELRNVWTWQTFQGNCTSLDQTAWRRERGREG